MTPARFPTPDRSRLVPNFVKTPDNEMLDIGWAEGVMSDGRAWRMECWAESQATFVNFFFSSVGMEEFGKDQFRGLLSREGRVEFSDSDPYSGSPAPLTDDSGNPMWCVFVLVGDEELHSSPTPELIPYSRSGQ